MCQDGLYFYFSPFISVKAHTEQKAANADEPDQPDHVVSALLFEEGEDKQLDLNKSGFSVLLQYTTQNV